MKFFAPLVAILMTLILGACATTRGKVISKRIKAQPSDYKLGTAYVLQIEGKKKNGKPFRRTLFVSPEKWERYRVGDPYPDKETVQKPKKAKEKPAPNPKKKKEPKKAKAEKKAKKSPTPKPSPKPKATPQPSPATGASSPKATPTPKASPTPESSPTSKATATPKPRATASPSPVPAASATPNPRPSATPRPSASPAVKAVSTPTPRPPVVKASPTPVVTPAPAPVARMKPAEEQAALEQARTKAAADATVRELRSKIHAARSDEEQRKASHDYLRALYGKMRQVSPPALKPRIDQEEVEALKK